MSDEVVRYDDVDFDISSEDLDKELEDFDLEGAKYEVWAIGYENNRISDIEVLLNTFNTAQEAVNFAYSVNTDFILFKLKDRSQKKLSKLDKFEIEVETVVTTEDETLNAGTIFRTELVV